MITGQLFSHHYNVAVTISYYKTAATLITICCRQLYHKTTTAAAQVSFHQSLRRGFLMKNDSVLASGAPRLSPFCLRGCSCNKHHGCFNEKSQVTSLAVHGVCTKQCIQLLSTTTADNQCKAIDFHQHFLIAFMSKSARGLVQLLTWAQDRLCWWRCGGVGRGEIHQTTYHQITERVEKRDMVSCCSLSQGIKHFQSFRLRSLNNWA